MSSNEVKFRVGDWVRVKNFDGLTRANEIGIVAELAYYIYHDYYKVIFNTVDEDGDYWNNFEYNDLEPIERPYKSFEDMIK